MVVVVVLFFCIKVQINQVNGIFNLEANEASTLQANVGIYHKMRSSDLELNVVPLNA